VVRGQWNKGQHWIPTFDAQSRGQLPKKCGRLGAAAVYDLMLFCLALIVVVLTVVPIPWATVAIGA